MLQSIVTSILFFLALSVFSQKERNIWYFGGNAGLDFNTAPPTVLVDGAMSTTEGCASVADANGNLLFYTNGMEIWNRNHTTMPNGSGLLGSWSSSQSALAIRKPGSSNIYYIFTTDAVPNNLTNGLVYSEVDMELDNGLGAVTNNKNIPLIKPTCEKVTAVRHANGTDIWVVTHEWQSDAFYAYLVTATGVSSIPIISNVGMVVSGNQGNAEGILKISPDGKHLAMANLLMQNALLCNFDDATGTVSNPLALTFASTFPFPYGIEFSPSNRFLYISTNNALVQYDLEALNIPTSSLTIATTKNLQALQLAPDKKIYATSHNLKALHVIHNPDALGTDCNLEEESIFLDGKFSKSGLPNFMAYIPAIDTFPNDTFYTFYVPNTISPNSDGINDSFFPKTSATITTYHLYIVNRWGEIVFETNDPNKKWNGEKNGKIVPVGTYQVVINYTIKNEQLKSFQRLNVIH